MPQQTSTEIEQAVLEFIANNPGAGRKAIRRGAAAEASETTVWRTLARLLETGQLQAAGSGRGTNYSLVGGAAVRAFLQTPYYQRPPVGYQRGFLDAYIPGRTFYLPVADRERLRTAGTPVTGPLPAGTFTRRILEQLLVDLSWASSRMEGNTYDLLQTDHLIKHGEAAQGKDREETLMVLNHKEAIEYLVGHLADISLSRRDLFAIHAMLSEELLADPGMRGRLRVWPVEIGHSQYKPLDDHISIAEEFDILLQKAAAIQDPYEQSFFLLVHIPYLQAFADVNKRTSRIAANIPLLKADLAPMSFLTVNDRDYVEGLLGVYEMNNTGLLREVYVDGYLASAGRYRSLLSGAKDPHKAAIAYRDIVKEAVRHCVLDLKAFQPEAVRALAAKRGVPEEDRDSVAEYVEREFRGLHEGNLIRYRLKPEDLQGLTARARTEFGH